MHMSIHISVHMSICMYHSHSEVEYDTVWDDKRGKYLASCVTGGCDEDRRGGAMGRAGFVVVPCVPHRDPHAVPPNAASCRPRAERPHAEGREFRPGAFPESTTSMDLPGGRWVDLRRHGLEM